MSRIDEIRARWSKRLVQRPLKAHADVIYLLDRIALLEACVEAANEIVKHHPQSPPPQEMRIAEFKVARAKLHEEAGDG